MSNPFLKKTSSNNTVLANVLGSSTSASSGEGDRSTNRQENNNPANNPGNNVNKKDEPPRNTPFYTIQSKKSQLSPNIKQTSSPMVSPKPSDPPPTSPITILWKSDSPHLTASESTITFPNSSPLEPPQPPNIPPTLQSWYKKQKEMVEKKNREISWPLNETSKQILSRVQDFGISMHGYLIKRLKKGFDFYSKDTERDKIFSEVLVQNDADQSLLSSIQTLQKTLNLDKMIAFYVQLNRSNLSPEDFLLNDYIGLIRIYESLLKHNKHNILQQYYSVLSHLIQNYEKCTRKNERLDTAIYKMLECCASYYDKENIMKDYVVPLIRKLKGKVEGKVKEDIEELLMKIYGKYGEEVVELAELGSWADFVKYLEGGRQMNWQQAFTKLHLIHQIPLQWHKLVHERIHEFVSRPPPTHPYIEACFLQTIYSKLKPSELNHEILHYLLPLCPPLIMWYITPSNITTFLQPLIHYCLQTPTPQTQHSHTDIIQTLNKHNISATPLPDSIFSYILQLYQHYLSSSNLCQLQQKIIAKHPRYNTEIKQTIYLLMKIYHHHEHQLHYSAPYGKKILGLVMDILQLYDSLDNVEFVNMKLSHMRVLDTEGLLKWIGFVLKQGLAHHKSPHTFLEKQIIQQWQLTPHKGINPTLLYLHNQTIPPVLPQAQYQTFVEEHIPIYISHMAQNPQPPILTQILPIITYQLNISAPLPTIQPKPSLITILKQHNVGVEMACQFVRALTTWHYNKLNLIDKQQCKVNGHKTLVTHNFVDPITQQLQSSTQGLLDGFVGRVLDRSEGVLGFVEFCAFDDRILWRMLLNHPNFQHILRQIHNQSNKNLPDNHRNTCINIIYRWVQDSGETKHEPTLDSIQKLLQQLQKPTSLAFIHLSNLVISQLKPQLLHKLLNLLHSSISQHHHAQGDEVVKFLVYLLTTGLKSMKQTMDVLVKILKVGVWVTKLYKQDSHQEMLDGLGVLMVRLLMMMQPHCVRYVVNRDRKALTEVGRCYGQVKRMIEQQHFPHPMHQHIPLIQATLQYCPYPLPFIHQNPSPNLLSLYYASVPLDVLANFLKIDSPYHSDELAINMLSHLLMVSRQEKQHRKLIKQLYMMYHIMSSGKQYPNIYQHVEKWLPELLNLWNSNDDVRVGLWICRVMSWMIKLSRSFLPQELGQQICEAISQHSPELQQCLLVGYTFIEGLFELLIYVNLQYWPSTLTHQQSNKYQATIMDILTQFCTQFEKKPKHSWKLGLEEELTDTKLNDKMTGWDFVVCCFKCRALMMILKVLQICPHFIQSINLKKQLFNHTAFIMKLKTTPEMEAECSSPIIDKILAAYTNDTRATQERSYINKLIPSSNQFKAMMRQLQTIMIELGITIPTNVQASKMLTSRIRSVRS